MSQALFALMAISSPPLPWLSPRSQLFSQERRRTKIQLKTSLDCRDFTNPQLEIKRQSHHRETKFSGEFSANGLNEADSEVRIDKRPNKHLVSSREIDSFGLSEGGVEKEGAKQASLQMNNEEKIPQIPVSQEVQSDQIQSEINSNGVTDLSRDEQSENNGNGEITGEEPWWYRLPCVLGILLSGGESEGAPGGLYSLEIKSNSTSRNPMSYVITFQDRVDATNFCYVLDPYFDDLNDVSAEIIPLTIQALKEEVRSARLNVIVIPKGKLKLHGGQTLEEVETELRCFVN